MKLLTQIRELLIMPLMSKQGVHLDPLQNGPPDMQEWSKRQLDVWNSAEMETFRDCLRVDHLDVRESVLDDLARYHDISPEEARERCLHWEAWSVNEWTAADRSTPEAVQAFYNSVESWSFDCLWYAYQQATGHAYPASILAAQFAQARVPGGAHLDFGSGVGMTSCLFDRLGFSSTMADVSPTLLSFARWRMERHGQRLAQINLTQEKLPSSAYDIVTAIDSLMCATDFDEAVADIHRALKPDGWLLANFDVRAEATPETAWHLYHSVVDLEHRLLLAGFKRVSAPEYMLPTYRRMALDSTEYRLRRQLLCATLPLRRLLEPAQRVRWPTPTRIRRVLKRLLQAWH
jgi:2-polyprenyl-3-methyl-5-hydroxy-6-metoxy-1,4-benzoquinol methylase